MSPSPPSLSSSSLIFSVHITLLSARHFTSLPLVFSLVSSLHSLLAASLLSFFSSHHFFLIFSFVSASRSSRRFSSSFSSLHLLSPLYSCRSLSFSLSLLHLTCHHRSHSPALPPPFILYFPSPFISLNGVSSPSPAALRMGPQITALTGP